MTPSRLSIIQRLGARLSKGDLRAASLMGTSGIVAQAVPLLTLPVLTRLYSPATMGSYAVWLSAVGLLSIVSSGRYELAAILPESDEKAASLVGLSLAVLAATCALVAVISFVVPLVVPVPAGLRGTIFLVPLTAFLMGVSQSFNYWQTRLNRFGPLGVSRIVQALVTAISAIGLGLLSPTPLMLAVAWAAGTAASAAILAREAAPRVFSLVRQASKGPGYWTGLAREYARYPVSNVPHALIDGFREAAVIFGFRYLFGAGQTGQMSIASRVSRAPAGLTGQALSQVYYRRAGEVERRSGDLRSDIARGARLVFLIGAIPTVILAATASWLVPLVLGEGWRDAGVYTAILAPAMLSMLVISPFSFVPHVKGAVDKALRFALLDLVLKAAAVGVGAFSAQPAWTVVLLSIETTVINIVVLRWYLHIAADRGAR